MTDQEILQWTPLVKKFSGKYFIEGMEREDLEQQFYMVVVRCYQHYKPSAKVKMITYLINSMRREVVFLLAKQNKRINSIPLEEEHDLYDPLSSEEPLCLPNISRSERNVMNMLLMGYPKKEVFAKFPRGKETLQSLREKFGYLKG